VLSEDEYQALKKAREEERVEQRAERRRQALKAASDAEKEEKSKQATKVDINPGIKSIQVYGDLRLRYESAEQANRPDTAEAVGAFDLTSDRWRYAGRIGLRGDLTDDWFYGLRLDTGTNPRSSWVTFGNNSNATAGGAGPYGKGGDGIQFGQAYLGWRAWPWLTVQAGKQLYPFFTTPMVWDPDINPEGLSEKFNYKINDNATLFATAGQFLYSQIGKRTGAWTGGLLDSPNPGLGASQSAMLFAYEAGAAYKFTADTTARAAVNYYKYRLTNDETVFNSDFQGSGGSVADLGIRNLQVVEIPMELRFPVASLSGAVFGEYAWNIDGKNRAAASATPQNDRLARPQARSVKRAPSVGSRRNGSASTPSAAPSVLSA